MKYVEAMISQVETPNELSVETLALACAADDLRAVLIPDAEGDKDVRLDGANEFEDMALALASLESEIDEHDCYDDAVPSLIPVGSTESINVQMERAGFLNGEVVVILRESDFLAMMKTCDTVKTIEDTFDKAFLRSTETAGVDRK